MASIFLVFILLFCVVCASAWTENLHKSPWISEDGRRSRHHIEGIQPGTNQRFLFSYDVELHDDVRIIELDTLGFLGFLNVEESSKQKEEARIRLSWSCSKRDVLEGWAPQRGDIITGISKWKTKVWEDQKGESLVARITNFEWTTLTESQSELVVQVIPVGLAEVFKKAEIHFNKTWLPSEQYSVPIPQDTPGKTRIHVRSPNQGRSLFTQFFINRIVSKAKKLSSVVTSAINSANFVMQALAGNEVSADLSKSFTFFNVNYNPTTKQRSHEFNFNNFQNFPSQFKDNPIIKCNNCFAYAEVTLSVGLTLNGGFESMYLLVMEI